MSYSDEQLALARTSPAGLAVATSRGRWRLTRHLDLIDELIVDSIAGRAPDRLIISVPPRHGKSELISRHTPPWYLGNFPERRVMLASYEARFASSWGRKARDLLEEHGHGLYGVKVRGDARAAEAWELDGHEGGMVTGGVGGPFTGKGADLMIIDDPVKNAEEADSEVIRDKHWDWWQSTASTRLHPNAVVLVVMTRWHEDDLAGRLLLGLDDESDVIWHEIRFPALAEQDDPLDRPEGAALWPDRFDEQWMARKRLEVGTRWFTSLYQGRPTPEEGGIFKRHWWRYYPRELWDALVGGDASQMPHFERIWQSWDTALKDKTTSDFTVGQVWGKFGPQRYLLRQTKGRLSYPEALGEMRTQAQWVADRFPKFAGHSIFVENAAMGPELVAAARRHLQGVIPVDVDRDKVSRAHAVTPQLEAGNVLVPGADHNNNYDQHLTPGWVQELIEECAGFPNSAHDDQVDALTQALDPRRHAGGKKPRTERSARTISAGVRAGGV